MLERKRSAGSSRTNFHSIADLAKPDGRLQMPPDNPVSTESSRFLKVKMEPSPTQSLISTFAPSRVVTDNTQQLTEWDAGYSNDCDPLSTSPAMSEDSGYGKEYINPLGQQYSDEDAAAMLFDEDSRAERLRKVRKQRTVFESNQLDMLEDTFKNNPYPSSDEYETLAKRISIDEARLRIWFQNRRARYRRSSKNVPNSPVPVSHFSVPNFATRHPILPASPFSQSQLLMLGAHPLMFGGF